MGVGRTDRVRVTGPLALYAAGFRCDLAGQGYRSGLRVLLMYCLGQALCLPCPCPNHEKLPLLSPGVPGRITRSLTLGLGDVGSTDPLHDRASISRPPRDSDPILMTNAGASSTAGLMVSLIFEMPGGGHGINVFTPVLRPAAPPPGMYCVPRSSSMSILHSYMVYISALSPRSTSGYSGRTAYSTLSPSGSARTPTTRTTRPGTIPSNSWLILALVRLDM